MVELTKPQAKLISKFCDDIAKAILIATFINYQQLSNLSLILLVGQLVLCYYLTWLYSIKKGDLSNYAYSYST